MRFSTFKKHGELIELRLQAINKQVSALSELSVVGELTHHQTNKLHLLSKSAVQKNNEFEKQVIKLFQTIPSIDDIDNSEISVLQDKISDLFISIQSTCEALLPTLQPEQSALNVSDTSGAPTQPTEAKHSVRLPKIILPTFSGQPEQWVAFQGIFETTIHKNGSLSNIEKFSYLLSCLSNEPLNLVKSLPLSAANYFLAWDKLVKRYHNTRLLITLHTSNILDLPQVNKPTVKQLRDFISVYNDNYQALKALNHDIAANENLVLTLHLLRKFDSGLRNEFERQRTDSKVMPTIAEFIQFLEDECSQQEAANLNSNQPTSSLVPPPKLLSSQKHLQSSKSTVGLGKYAVNKPKSFVMSVSASKQQQMCVYCKATHKIFQCENFNALTPQDRYTAIKDKGLCLNCFGTHKTGSCKSLYSCKRCMKRHHTLLHFQRPEQTVPSDVPQTANLTSPTQVLDNSNADSGPGNTLVATSCSSGNMVLLATALVSVSTENGNQIVVRAVLDSASQTTIISEYCANMLKVVRSHANVPEITGISSSHVRPKGLTSVNLSSLEGSTLATSHPVLILDKISGDMPRTQLSPNVRAQLKGYTLADPKFDTPGPIDVLIGADLFTQTLVGPTVALGDNMPHAINTIFGFVILGNAPVLQSCNSQYSGLTSLLSVNDIDLHSMLQRFWQIEEPPQCSKLSPQEQECETHFVNTHSRDSSGRFVCRLPFKDDPSKLGQSSNIAKSTFLSMERKFESYPELKSNYVGFMDEYLSSGHMKLRPSDETSIISEPHCFLPHHSVFKDGKIRVVFNASSPTTSGISLNNILHQGPKLHNEIRDIILRFRFYKIAFTCDIKQMFRMISIHHDDQLFQLIFWRNHPSHPLKTYQLTTVTFGMTSSPFLANRVIRELITKEEDNYPKTSKVLQQQIYVDDALLGANSIEEALTLRNEVIGLLEKGGFELRKWTSNNKIIFEGLPAEHCVTTVLLDQHFVGILGLKWNPEADYFSYSIEKPSTMFTKRSILSTIARIYDVTGMLAPLTLWAKALMQHVWALGLDWDAPLPLEVADRWSTFIEELHFIEDLRIPRYLSLDNAVNIQLHGFADASELGYAACVYVRTEDAQANVAVNLLIAKSKVAPLKRITIPRLELCGAHILANLINYCVTQLSDKFQINSITAWSDSTIALSWIHTPAYRLKLYVANRVSLIQELTPSCIWKHVPTNDNPADCASRGLTASNLKNNDLWWFGPLWLQAPPSSWPPSRFTVLEEDLPEVKTTSINLLSAAKSSNFEFISKPRYSSWKSLLHIMGYVLRFITCIKNKSKITQPLTREELNESENRICCIVQAETFSQEIDLLKKTKICSKRFQRLSPFLDNSGIIRVGGRLKHSNLSYDNKYQIILPKNHAVVDLLIDHYHKINLHAGPQQLQALLQEKFWILNARSVVRSRVFKCLKCFRAKPKLTAPLMGDLPSDRVIPSRCFNVSAVDYAGPFTIKFFRLRGAQPLKVYICLFICLATKAIHLEVVTDLTAESFIASLTRFISRRGLVSDLYSDCGTNFIGTASSLKKCFEDLMQDPVTQQFAENHQVKFHFNPPRAPHQGGLWERAIKSMKYHLTRVMGEQILTYEEFLTLTVRIEAILNSRPITPLSADPNDMQPLTPGHFLTGGPLTSLIEPYLLDSTSHLHRWRLTQAFTQHFWSRWQREYLQTLQERSKWTLPQPNLQVGDLVVIHEDNTPPLTWKMGRITGVSPGKDGIVRVVHLRTTKGTLTRPAVKVFRLPIH